MEYICPECSNPGGYLCEEKCLRLKLEDLREKIDSLCKKFKGDPPHTFILRGKDINCRFTFYKFLGKDLIQHGYQYQIGRNDEKPGNFSPLEECNKGLFFVPLQWGLFWLYHARGYVAEIEIPGEAEVVIFLKDRKMKTDSLIIKNLIPWDTFDKQIFKEYPEVTKKLPTIKHFLNEYESLNIRMKNTLEKIPVIAFYGERTKNCSPQVCRELISVLNTYLAMDPQIENAVSIASNLPPVHADSYDYWIHKFGHYLFPRFNCLPPVFRTIYTADRCFEIISEKHRMRLTFSDVESAINLIKDNLDFFRSKPYWSKISGYL